MGRQQSIIACCQTGQRHMMDVWQRRRTGVRTHARAELKMQNRGASLAHGGTTEARCHTNYCNAHTHMCI